MRLIDADALEYTRVQIFHGLNEDGTPCVGGWNAVLMSRTIKDAPTVDAVILPCKIGDTVWTIMYGEIREAKVTCIRPFVFEDFVEFRGNAVITMAHPFYSDGRTLTQEPFIIFGKDTFLTREEAEAALVERKKVNEND